MGGCPEGEFCPSSPEEAYCTKIPIKKEEGEECTKQEECKSSICEENKCKTLADGEECKKHYHCGQFSYCDEISSQCKPLVKEGGKCNTSFECGFDLACANFVCKKMFSLPTGEATDNWQVCQTGRSFELSTGEYCVEKKQNTPTCPTNYEKTCEFTVYSGETEKPYTYKEWCLPNWNYEPFCENGSDSKELQEFLRIYREETAKIDPKTIKVTELRNSFWNEKTNRAKWTAMFYAKVKGAEKCVYDYFDMNYLSEKYSYFLE